MNKEYTPPCYLKENFHCPHADCGAFAHVNWVSMAHNVVVSLCDSCRKPAIWRTWTVDTGEAYVSYQGEMVYPAIVAAPFHHPDLPEHIWQDYEEARVVCAASPRAAAALLRLCLQKLCHHLLGKEGDINSQIGELVALGLPRRAQQAFDAIRVMGNESVHPGTINLNDTPELVYSLFRLLNLIVQTCITGPREAEDMFNLLPENKRKGIEARDKPKS